jgi:hypothetical protein
MSPFPSQNLDIGIKTTQNFMLTLKSAEKNAKNLLVKKLKAKKVCKIGVRPLLY